MNMTAQEQGNLGAWNQFHLRQLCFLWLICMQECQNHNILCQMNDVTMHQINEKKNQKHEWHYSTYTLEVCWSFFIHNIILLCILCLLLEICTIMYFYGITAHCRFALCSWVGSFGTWPAISLTIVGLLWLGLCTSNLKRISNHFGSNGRYNLKTLTTKFMH